jgi:hypothetical protein
MKLPLLIAGVVINTFLFGQFITSQKLDSILNAIQNNKLESFKDKTIKGATRQVLTTLPKTGPQNLFPVLYETDGKGLYVTYITLSASTNDYEAARKNLYTIYNQLKCPLVKDRRNGFSVNKTGDTTTIEFDRRNRDKHYMAWYLMQYQQSASAKFVTLAIKTMAYDLIDKPQELKVQATLKKDPKSYTEIFKIMEAAKKGFFGNRFYPSKDFLHRWEFETDLVLSGFDEFEIKINRSLTNNMRNPTYIATLNKSNQAVFDKYVNLIESGLMVIIKEKTKEGFAYLIKGKDDIIINIKKTSSEVSFEVSNTDNDVIIENPDSPFGINNMEREKLINDIANKLQPYILEGISIGKGFGRYPKAEKELEGDSYESVITQNMNLPYATKAVYFEPVNKGSKGIVISLKDNANELYGPALQIIYDNLKKKGLIVSVEYLKGEKQNTQCLLLNKELIAAVANVSNMLFLYEKASLQPTLNTITEPDKINTKPTTNPEKIIVSPAHSFSKLQVGSIKNSLSKIIKSVNQEFKPVIKKITYKSDDRNEYETKICLFTDVTNKTYPTINATITEATDFMGKKEIYFTERFAYKYEEMKALFEEILDKQIWQVVPQKRLGIDKTTVYKSKDCIIELVGNSIDCYMRVGKFYYYYE